MKATLVLITGFVSSLLLISNESFAQETKEPAPRIDFQKAIEKFVDEETSASIRYRNEHRNNGAPARNQMQYRLDLMMKFQLTPDGKLVLRSRAQTGSKFDSGWDETGIGQNVDRTFNMRLKQLFVDYSPTERLSVQGGAMPVIPKTIKGKGVLSIDTDGWVDGARANYSKLASWANQIAVTVGQVDEFQDTNAFDRKWGSPNFIQVHIQGDLSERVRYVGEYTRLEEDNYVRGLLEIALKDVLSFVDSVVLEDIIRVGEGAGHGGFAASIKKAIGDWKMTSQYSYKDAYISRTSSGALLLEDLYRQGHQITFQIERPTRWGTAYVSVGKTINGTKTVSNQGLRLDALFKMNLPKRK